MHMHQRNNGITKQKYTMESINIICLLGLISMLHLFPTVLSQIKGDIGIATVTGGKQSESKTRTFIVQVRKQNQNEDVNEDYHIFFKHAYTHVINGFAAEMTTEQASELEKKEGVLSIRPEKILSLHTKHSPDFLGLRDDSGVWKDSNFGKGVIIGIIDTGIRPDHPAFYGDGMPPPPAKWKGKCDFNGQPTCNNKLIGATNFFDGSSSGIPPIDYDGHGTLLASVAAGGVVMNAGEFDNAKGKAIGIAPQAHLAIYKVCNSSLCPESAILAAIDVAIDDGVDIICMSFGEDSVPFSDNLVAVGALAAIQNGIFVSSSAGNQGPKFGTISNEAPWLLTVGASTIDRSQTATVKLGNGVEYNGESLFQPEDYQLCYLPLIYAKALQNPSAVFCAPGSLQNFTEIISGKVVLCERGGNISRIEKGGEVKNAGALAMILVNQQDDDFSVVADPHVLPASHISYDAGLKIKEYISSSPNPTATIIFKGTVFGDHLSPSVASFSSRGPNFHSIGILKPDIIGPGVSILGAWPISMDKDTNRKATFNMMSGTSVSCSHLSGIAALLKSSHPDWSPSAIKSAIITTADVKNLEGMPILDETHEPADLFATGAGHVNPTKANDPGLVYDIQIDDYIAYLCGLGYSDTRDGMLVQKVVKCDHVRSIEEGQLNYPSFSIVLGNKSQNFTRTMTNVGPVNSTYRVETHAPLATDVGVIPSTITFTEVNQKVSYSVRFVPQNIENKNLKHAQGYLRWVSDMHTVTSPISVLFIES